MDESSIVNLKAENGKDEFEVSVDYDYHSPFEDEKKNPQSVVVKQQMQDLKIKLDELDDKIDSLENHADGVDYAVAAGSGIIAGVLDIFFVDDFSLAEANRWGNEQCSQMFSKFAGSENSFVTLASKYAPGTTISGDVSKSASMLGLIASVFTGLTGMSVMASGGAFSFQPVKMNVPSYSGIPFFDRVFEGVKNWGINTALSGTKAKGVASPVSNMLYKAGSEVGSQDSVKLASMSDTGIVSSGFDFGTELGVLKELGIQAIPVLINEAVVRAFYFVRHMFMEMKEANAYKTSQVKKINWKNTIPFNNRTVARMITISTSVLSAVDIADAAIESGISGVTNVTEFMSHFVVKLNYVGLGRCLIALGNDMISGGRLQQSRKKRSELRDEYLRLTNAQIFFKSKDAWVAAEDTEKVILEAKDAMNYAIKYMEETKSANKESLQRISNAMDKAMGKNPELKNSIEGIMNWE